MVTLTSFLSDLAAYEAPLVYNPWRDYDAAYDSGPQAPQQRLENLRRYLEPRLGRSPYLVVAEAVGYQGGRFTGIAMTCERMLLGHHKEIGPRDIVPAHYVETEDVHNWRTSHTTSAHIPKDIQRRLGFNEPTDTVVWGAIKEAGLSPFDVILWNMFPFHPHKLNAPLTNRTPKDDELQAGMPFFKALLALNGGGRILAVGQKAAQTLAEFGYQAHPLRHPANGGAGKYREGFAAYIAEQGRCNG